MGRKGQKDSSNQVNCRYPHNNVRSSHVCSKNADTIEPAFNTLDFRDVVLSGSYRTGHGDWHAFKTPDNCYDPKSSPLGHINEFQVAFAVEGIGE